VRRMIDRLPVEVVFQGEPFDRSAVVHTLRHLAMRVGWVLQPKAEHRLVYATFDQPRTEVKSAEGDVVVLSSPLVVRHLEQSSHPIPLAKTSDGQLLPFPHPEMDRCERLGWIGADVIAGSFAMLNLWYERHYRKPEEDGWVRWVDDLMAHIGLSDPQPLADQWLDRIQSIADQVGWPRTAVQEEGGFLGAPLTLVLVHDVDYLPREWDRGLPRLVRALARQVISRRRPADALRVLARYVQAISQGNPYFELENIAAAEGRRGVHSSFHVTVARHHRVDPAYDIRNRQVAQTLRQLGDLGWEVGLHSSYTASRTQSRIGFERAELERVLNKPVLGHSHHYLNFHPGRLFVQLEEAGFQYDVSVGYNDRSGPRAGTLFPYRPFAVEKGRPHELWEIPFVLMDTTLATTYRLTSEEAWAQVRAVLEGQSGCVSVIWHQEQLGGLLDPGFDRVYYRLIDWALEAGVRLTTGKDLLPDLDAAWAGTITEIT
jgi:hypothetical protein